MRPSRRALAAVVLALSLVVFGVIANGFLAKVGGDVRAYALPEGGIAPLLRELRAAERLVDLSAYLLHEREIVDTLIDLQHRGRNVRVLIERDPYSGQGSDDAISLLREGGVDVRHGNPAFRLNHAGYAVVDDRRAMVLTANFVASAFEWNRDFLVVTDDAPRVAAIREVFEADWERREPRVSHADVLAQPGEDRDRLIAFIDQATRSLRVYAVAMQDRPVQNALARAAERGVAVRVLMSPADAQPDPDDPGWRSLTRAGAEVRLLERPHIHAKAMLADGERLFVGSHNFTEQSLDLNRELGLLFASPGAARIFADAFERDWEAGRTSP